MDDFVYITGHCSVHNPAVTAYEPQTLSVRCFIDSRSLTKALMSMAPAQTHTYAFEHVKDQCKSIVLCSSQIVESSS